MAEVTLYEFGKHGVAGNAQVVPPQRRNQDTTARSQNQPNEENGTRTHEIPFPIVEKISPPNIGGNKYGAFSKGDAPFGY